MISTISLIMKFNSNLNMDYHIKRILDNNVMNINTIRIQTKHIVNILIVKTLRMTIGDLEQIKVSVMIKNQ